jgi:hypothetical protein
MYFVVQVSLLLVSRVWEISSGIDPCFPSAEGLCIFTPSPEGNNQYSANQAASQSTFINEQLYSTYD